MMSGLLLGIVLIIIIIIIIIIIHFFVTVTRSVSVVYSRWSDFNWDLVCQVYAGKF